eukprot:g5783.t1
MWSCVLWFFLLLLSNKETGLFVSSSNSTLSSAAKVIYTSGGVVNVRYLDSKLGSIKNIAAAVWVVDFDQTLYFNHTDQLLTSITDANKLMGLTRIICDNGKVMIDSHPEYGMARAKVPRFALPLTKSIHYAKPNLKRITESLKKEIFEQGIDQFNRFAVAVLFEKGNHGSQYCHSGICVHSLHSCKVKFLSTKSQDWSPPVSMTTNNGHVIIADTRPYDLRALLQIERNRKSTVVKTFPTQPKNSSKVYKMTKLPRLTDHPIFSHTENPSRKRINPQYFGASKNDGGKTEYFPTKWFTHEEYYSFLQVMVNMQTHLFIGGDPNPNMDAFQNIAENQMDKWMFALTIPTLTEMLHKVLEPTLMDFLGPMVNRIFPGSQPQARRRLLATSGNKLARFLRHKFSKVKTENERKLSANDKRVIQNIRKKVSPPLKRALQAALDKHDKMFPTRSAVINQRKLFFKRIMGQIMPRAEKWRWQHKNPDPEFKPIKIPPAKVVEEPMPKPIKHKKPIPEPCMGLKGPESVANCIKNAFSPVTMKDPKSQLENDKAYMDALKDAQIAESLEDGFGTKSFKPVSLKKTKKLEIKETKLGALEKRVQTAMDEIKSLHSLPDDSRRFSFAVFRRLKDRVRRRRREVNNGKLPEEMFPESTVATSFLELFVGLRSGGCDVHQSVNSCEKQREQFEVAGAHGPESGKCVWCTRREGGAEEGRCVEEAHGADIESRAAANGISGVKCHAFSPVGYPPLGKSEQENPDDINPIKKPHVQTETNTGWTPTAEQLADTNIETTMMMIMDRIHEEASIGLKMTVNNTVFRTTNAMLTEAISNGLVESLSETLTALLSRSVLRVGTKEITADLVPTVTHILSSSLTMSLTRSPKNDFYCTYCKTYGYYCTYCIQSSKDDYAKDYYANYFAQYYSKYYTFQYVDVFAEGFAGESIIDGSIDRD